MRTTARTVRLLVLVVPALVFLVAAGIYFVRQLRSLESAIPRILTSDLSVALGREVRIGSAEVSARGTAVLHDVKIGERRPSRELFAAVDRVEVSFEPGKLLSRRNPPAAAVKRVRMSGLTVWIRRTEQGQWNVRQLFAGLRPGQPIPFHGAVDVESARVILVDLGAPGGRKAARFENIYAAVDFSTLPVLTFNAHARSSSLVVSGFRAAGTHNVESKALSLALDVRKADAPWWSPYARIPSWMPVGSGSVSGGLEISRLNRVNSYAGRLTLENADVYLKPVGLQAHGFGGSLQFAGRRLRLNLRGRMEGMPVECIGSIAISPGPSLDLVCRAPRIGPRLANNLLPRLGQVNLRFRETSSAWARIRGTAPDISVEFSGTSDLLAAAGQDVRAVVVSGIYRNKRLRISSAKFDTLGGTVWAEGSVGTRGARSLDLSGGFESIELARFAHRGGLQASGGISGVFTIGGNLARPEIRFSAAVPAVKVNGLKLAVRRIEGAWRGDRLQVLSSQVSAAGGVFMASGFVASSGIDLKVTAEDVAIEKIPKLFGGKVRGSAFAQARIAGSLKSPEISADVQLYNAQYRSVAFNKAAGRVLLKGHKVDLQDWVASSYPTEAHLNGSIMFPQRAAPYVDLRVAIKDGQAEQIAQSLEGNLAVSGSVSADLRVLGAYPEIGAEGVISLTNGVIGGYAVDSATAALVRAGTDILLQRFRAETALGSWDGTGTISLDRRLNLAVSGAQVPLEHLNPRVRPYASLGGEVDLDAEIGGTLSGPTLRGRVAGSDLTVNGAKVQSFFADVVWDGMRFAVPNAKIVSGGEYSLADLAYLPKTKELRSKVKVHSASVNQLVQMLRASDYARRDPDLAAALRRVQPPTTGKLTAVADLDLSPDSRSVSLRVGLEDAVIGGTEAGKAELDAKILDDEIAIRDFRLVGPDLNVSASGKMTTDGEIEKLDISAYNVSTALLKQFVKLPDVSGLLNVDVSVTGRLDAPRLVGSADLASAVVYGRKFDLLSLSQFTVSPNPDIKGRATVELSDAVFSTGGFDSEPGFAGRAYGTIPWDWNTFSVPDDQQMALNLELKNQNTAALVAMAPDFFNPAMTSGKFTIDLAAKGTPSARDLRGTLKIEGATLAIRKLETPLTDLNGEIVFEGNTARITSLAGRSAGGGTFKVEGTADVPSFRDATLQTRLAAKDFRLTADNLSGIYNERLETTVTTEALTASGKLTAPKIAGKIVLRDSTIHLRSQTETRKKEKPNYAVNPSFDLKVDVAPDSWVRNPRLAAKITGDASVGGTLEFPRIKGGFRVARGTFLLPTARLRLRPGGIINVDYAPPEVSRVALDLEARTSVYTVSRIGTRQRYEVVMEIGGSPANPDIQVSSIPPGLPESHIIALLGHVGLLTGDSQQALRQDIAGVFTAAATPYLLSPIESAITEAFGLEEFAIEYEPRQPVGLYFSTKLAGNFFTSYRRSVGAIQEEYEFAVGYRFSPRLQASIGIDEQQIVTMQVAGTKRF